MTLLGASEFRRAVAASLDDLRARRQEIDAANVYPVPDADTGTNLVMTFEAVAAALERAGDTDAEVAHALKSGSLMGARGNAGVIMAQILRAWAESIEAGPAGVEQVARAFKRSVELSYEAVLEPAEGTILSIARAASDAAHGGHPDVARQFGAAARAGAEALERTPEQLAVLARAGVVDAGGMGLVTVLRAFARALGDPEAAAPPVAEWRAPAAPPACEPGSLGYALEVQYMLDAPEDRIPPLRQLLGTIGDSVAVSGGGGTWRVHVHTNDRDGAVAFGEAIGAVSAVDVVSLADQVAARAPGERGVELARAPVRAGLVAVVWGDGVGRLFGDLGARAVAGDPGMRIHSERLAEAIEAAPAEDVVVLPNHEEAFFAAQEVAAVSPKRVTVLRTTDQAEGLAAAVAYGDARSAADNVADMQAAIDRVRTGLVVVAPAAMETPLGSVAPGQAIGFASGAEIAIESDPVAAAAGVVGALMGRDGSVVTVLAGEEADERERARLQTALRTTYPSATIEVHAGGQPVHRYLVSVE